MDFFPVFVNLAGQPVLLVGGGSVAERKARLLLKASARLRVVADQLNAQFQAWQAEGRVEHLGKEYRPEHMEGARLVFAATDNRELNARVFADAETAGVLANVVDDPTLCRFLSPAIVDRSPVQVAISTGGNSPVLARVIRGWVERLLPLGLGRVAEVAGALRETVKQSIPVSQRRGFWENLLEEKRLRSWSLQDRSQISQQMQTAIEAFHAPGPGRPQKDPAPSQGKVFLVGAGPGRADLLTLRALHVLGQADVILHDQLVSEEVLDMARRDAERIDVGKRAGDHHRSQDEIHSLMEQHSRLGKTVVRLKGGDPFVFGRGGEELEYLRQLGINYEVVPGISAGLACAAYTGIPLTHRDHAASLTFVTGHAAARPGDMTSGKMAGVDWRAIAGPGRTAVIYMGLKQAEKIQKELLKAGISHDLPVAFVSNGSMETQRVRHGTVGELSQLARRIEAGAPTLLIIGQVAALGSNLAWFNNIPQMRVAA